MVGLILILAPLLRLVVQFCLLNGSYGNDKYWKQNRWHLAN